MIETRVEARGGEDAGKTFERELGTTSYFTTVI